MKFICHWIGCIFLISLLLVSAAFADSTVTVTGSATIMAAPDIFQVSASARVISENVGNAQETLSQIIDTARKSLLNLGLAEEDIVTSYYTVYPMYKYIEETQEQHISGYQASHSLTVTCKDLSLLNSVLQALTDSSINEIGNISFDISNRHEVYLQALGMALQAAHEKAEVLAKSSNTELKEIEHITEHDQGDQVLYSNMKQEAGATDRYFNSGIRTDGVSVTAMLTVEYKISND